MTAHETPARTPMYLSWEHPHCVNNGTSLAAERCLHLLLAQCDTWCL